MGGATDIPSAECAITNPFACPYLMHMEFAFAADDLEGMIAAPEVVPREGVVLPSWFHGFV